MSNFNVNDFLRSVHRNAQKKQVRFDKDAFQKALNASLCEQVPGLSASGRSALFVYFGNLDLLRVARGIAAASTRTAQIVELASDDSPAGNNSVLARPLLHGQVLILVHFGTSAIPANLAESRRSFAKIRPDTWLRLLATSY